MVAKNKTINFERIDSYLEDQMDKQAIAGLAYVIVQGDKIVHSKAFGKADIGTELSVQTPMKLASLSKSFTALAVMQLVDQGKIDLDAPVRNYIPWFQLKDNDLSKGITIRHLLNQTSGIQSDGELVLGTELLNKSQEETVRLMKRVGLSHPVGTEFEYSNLNYVSLGLVVEHVTGKSLADYIQTEILSPLQMNNSYTSVEEARKHGLSKDFTSWFGMLVPTRTMISDLPNFLASGYMISSAEDMGKYLLMYMNKGEFQGQSILSDKGIQTLQTPAKVAKMVLDGQYFGNYAMGWWERTVQGTKIIGHSGDLFSAARTDMYILPEQEMGVIVLSNTNNGNFAPGDSHISTEGVISLLIGKEPMNREEQGFEQYYMIFDVIVALIIASFILYIVKLKKRKATHVSITKWFVISTGLQLFLPVSILIAAPKWLGIPSWGYLFFVQADLVSVLLITLLSFITIGVIKIVWLLQNIRRNHYNSEMKYH
ncbi:serine hydrolase [Bacillus sp. S/N-304-OC-R1]|uniref:serine hydrolase domain-containing protein n=1 Tax=Bacillus sp. S/N-304-OC-R1 TaxID=2758034 RepID=UPI001C8E6F4E|nr:serine hydrolase domain-containing protein [Bacillus sp. S/N-304-OC-R1]MBY0123573.1 beta-lactamase family protein [Bacillus sp. S/N-304-OC-R1]